MGHESYERKEARGIVQSILRASLRGVFALSGSCRLSSAARSDFGRWRLRTFLIVALAPALLAPLNRLWLKFGLLLHRIVSPVVLGIMFFGVITPMALMRLFGKDPLRLKFDTPAKSTGLRANHRVRRRRALRINSSSRSAGRSARSAHLESVNGSCSRTLALHEGAQEVLAGADPWVMLLLGGLLVLAKGSAVAPFIYTLFCRCAFSASRPSITTAPRPWSRRRDRRRRTGGALHAQEARPGFSRECRRVLPEAGGHGHRRSTSSPSTTSRC